MKDRVHCVDKSSKVKRGKVGGTYAEQGGTGLEREKHSGCLFPIITTLINRRVISSANSSQW